MIEEEEDQIDIPKATPIESDKVILDIKNSGSIRNSHMIGTEEKSLSLREKLSIAIIVPLI
jgi:hypothetical protein